MENFGKAALTIFGAIITLAIVSVIVSKKSDSAGLVRSLGNSLSSVINSAVTPVPAAASHVGSVPAASAVPGYFEGLLDHFTPW